MQAQGKRHINPSTRYDPLIPQSIHKDTVVVGRGKAQLEDTLQLMKRVIAETLQDSQKLAPKLKGNTMTSTCKNIWEFVYTHIQYTMDKTGIEQVRRPSRTWADRMTGVDCDCYTVFIGSILVNLGIPFKMRITKYGGKHHFQHIYPIISHGNSHITMDCVADSFNYEVPYSEKKDIDMSDFIINSDSLSGLSGVDMADIGLHALEQESIPLHTVRHFHKKQVAPTIKPTLLRQTGVSKAATTLSPYRFEEDLPSKRIRDKKKFNLLNFLIISGISIAAGVGVLKLLTGSARGKKSTGSNRGTRSTRGNNQTKKKYNT